MGPGGCDKTQEMIDEWNEKIKDLNLREEGGAGFEATKLLVRKYIKDTPGAVETIKRIVRNKYKHKLL